MDSSTHSASRYLSRRKAWATIFLWLFFAGIMFPSAWQFTTRLRGTFSGVENTAPSQVRKALVENFSSALAFPCVLVWDASGLPLKEAQTKWEETVKSLHDVPGVTQIHSGVKWMNEWPRDDWFLAFIELKAETFGNSEILLPEIRKHLHETIKFPESHPIYLTGGPAMFLDLNLSSTQSLREAELIAIPIAFLILFIVFRTPVAAILPIFVAGIGVLITLGLLSYLALFLPVTFFVPNLITMIGLGVGIDYCLIYLARYRREKTFHLTSQEALHLARKTAGHTVLVSSVLVITGFLALLVIPLSFFTSIALGGMLIVGCVAAATLTLLPAFVLLLGPALEWGEIYSTTGVLRRRVQAFYRWWAKILLLYPGRFFLLGTALLFFISWPITRLEITSLQVNTLPKGTEARLGYESVAKMLGPGWLIPTIILAQHPNEDWWKEEPQAIEQELVAQIKALAHTHEVLSSSDQNLKPETKRARAFMLEGNKDLTQNIILAISRDDPQSRQSREWLKALKQVLQEHMEKYPEGARYLLGGIPSIICVTDDVIFHYLPFVIGLTLFTTFFLLMFFMKSIFVPLKAILLNLFCVLAAYGFLVSWFQEGMGALVADFIVTDGLNTIVMVIMFCSLFGLSMDYEIFILSSIRESWLNQKNMNIAIEEGLEKTAGIITSAAIILVSVFLAFAFGSVVETQQLGVGMSFAVLLDATLIRCILVPSTMAMMGQWNWWLPGQPFPRSTRQERPFDRRLVYRRLRRFRRYRSQSKQKKKS